MDPYGILRPFQIFVGHRGRVFFAWFLAALIAPHSIGALGLKSLNLPGSAAQLSLAMGGVALPAGKELLLVNPAHVWGRKTTAISYSYLGWFGGLTGHNLSWYGSWRNRPAAMVLRSMGDEGLELRTDTPTAQPIGSFGARHLSLTLSTGWQTGATHWGVNITGISQRLYHYSAGGIWVSAGGQGEIGTHLLWGATLQHAGVGTGFRETAASMPLRAGLGLSWRSRILRSTLGGEVWYDRYRGFSPGILWQRTGDYLNINLGVRLDDHMPLVATGFEFAHRRWSVSVAYGFKHEALGQPHILTVTRQL